MLRLITQSQQNQILSYPFSNVLYSQKSLENGSPRILILYSGLLLDDLIASLFCDQPDLQIRITQIDKEEAIAQAIASEKPQTVILCKSDSFAVEKLNLLLEELHFSDPVQVFVVSLNGNSLEVDSKKKLVFNNFRSFIDHVKSSCLTVQ